MSKTSIDEKREIRVFVSSTFLDLQDERDHIIRRTFPRIADYCRKRGILFTGVDLRWGITEEQSKEGRTVRLCLDEIRKAHPFYINILGQRYGWIINSQTSYWDYDISSTVKSQYYLVYGNILTKLKQFDEADNLYVRLNETYNTSVNESIAPGINFSNAKEYG